MKIIDEKKTSVLDEEVTVKMTVGELAAIATIFGRTSPTEREEMIIKGRWLDDIYKQGVHEYSDDIYFCIADFLEEKDVYNGV